MKQKMTKRKLFKPIRAWALFNSDKHKGIVVTESQMWIHPNKESFGPWRYKVVRVEIRPIKTTKTKALKRRKK